MKKIKLKTPKYWDLACNELSKKDKKLAKLIIKYDSLKIQSHGDPFTTLTRSIIGQQISVAAAESIWKKLCFMISGSDNKDYEIILISPSEILKNYYKLNSVGLSTRKKNYIYALATHFVNNKDFSGQLLDMNDECVNNTLISFSGIGTWTIRNAIYKIYNVKDNGKQLENIVKLSEKWKPWRTVATWYLWCSIDPDPINY